MMEDILFNAVCSFLGTVGLALTYNVPKRFLLGCGITGMMGWMAYFAVRAVEDQAPYVAGFAGALMVAFVSRIMAVYMKCPITLFLISGIVPLVPGAGIYKAVYYTVVNNPNQAFAYALTSVKMAFAIVIGMIIIYSFPRDVFSKAYWQKRFKTKVEAGK